MAPVVNLRLMRASAPNAFFDDQLEAMIAARDDGLIGAVGLSNVSRAQLQYATQSVDVACVQNAFHPADRSSEPVLEECTRQGVAFVPFAPLGFGSTALLTNPTVARVVDPLALHGRPSVPGLGAGHRPQCPADPRHGVAGSLARELGRGRGQSRRRGLSRSLRSARRRLTSVSSCGVGRPRFGVGWKSSGSIAAENR